MTPEPPFRIQLDGRWLLPDFGSFTRVFNQAYSIVLVIEYDGEFADSERLQSAFSSHAWRGSGFSAANFYQDVRSAVPRSLRPRIQAIQYASPGFIDLALLASAALTVSILVKRVVASFREITDYYDRIYKQLHERKLTKIQTREAELELLKKEQVFLRECSDGLAAQMDFKQVERIRQLTGNDLATLKILLGLFRYIRELAKYERDRKAVLPPASGKPSDGANPSEEKK